MTRAIMIAAPRSGGGKTTTTLGLLAALRGRNIAVQAAKTGPDYIDPAFHEVVTGRSSLNLDSWAMTPSLLETMLARSAEGANLLVVESAMGLFDGLFGPKSRAEHHRISRLVSIFRLCWFWISQGRDNQPPPSHMASQHWTRMFVLRVLF